MWGQRTSLQNKTVWWKSLPGTRSQHFGARDLPGKITWQRQLLMHKQNIPVGIGVHAGVAYFGAMGSSDGLVDISAIGEEVNTAARIASKAAAGEILLSEAALERAHTDVSTL